MSIIFLVRAHTQRLIPKAESFWKRKHFNILSTFWYFIGCEVLPNNTFVWSSTGAHDSALCLSKAGKSLGQVQVGPQKYQQFTTFVVIKLLCLYIESLPEWTNKNMLRTSRIHSGGQTSKSGSPVFHHQFSPVHWGPTLTLESQIGRRRFWSQGIQSSCHSSTPCPSKVWFGHPRSSRNPGRRWKGQNDKFSKYNPLPHKFTSDPGPIWL